MPRTTIQLDRDALKVAKTYAVRHRVTLGQAVSTLVSRGAERPLATMGRNGFRVVQLGRRSPVVTAAQVERLLTN